MKQKSFIAFIIVSLLASTVSLCADEVLDAIDAGQNAYNEGDFMEAAHRFESAAQLAREKVSEQLGEFLPEIPDDWKRGDPQYASAAGTLFGGGNSVEARYTNGKKSVTVVIAANSPMLESMMMLANNSAFLEVSGKRIERFGGQKSIVEFDEVNMQGSINVIVVGSALVTIDGSGTDLKLLKMFANSIPYPKLIEMLMQ